MRMRISGLKAGRDQIRFHKQLKIGTVYTVVAVVQDDQLRDPRKVRFRIAAGGQKIADHRGRFDTLLFRAAVPVFFLAALDGDIVQDCSGAQALLLRRGPVFPLAEELCKGVNVQNVLCAAQVPVFVAQCVVEQAGLIWNHKSYLRYFLCLSYHNFSGRSICRGVRFTAGPSFVIMKLNLFILRFLKELRRSEWRRAVLLTYSFENIGPESLYMHLYRCIREDIASGEIAAGSKLPSKRSLAKNLGVSVITVENAYAQLISEGYLYSVPKKGFFAAALEKTAVPEKTEFRMDPLPAAPKYFADFASNRTDPENFPFATWAKLTRETISGHSAELMMNAPCGGIPELRQAIAEHLHAFRGIQADPNRILVGAGTEYLYGLLIQLLGFDKVYALEDPGYRKIMQIYESHGVQYRFVPMDGEGVSPAELRRSGADVLHISPSHHFPTGIVTPATRRYALLRWAAQSPQRYIIEDDYDSEFRLTGKPIPALQSIDGAGRVIYMNTFTKSLASTIRISYMVLPAELAARFYARLGFYACTVSNLEQYTLAKFIADGHFEKHINRMRNRYKIKKDRILQEMERCGLFRVAQIEQEDSGLHFLLRVSNGTPPREILRRALESGVRITCLSDYFHREQREPEAVFVISYSAIPDERIPEAVARLTKAILGA